MTNVFFKVWNKSISGPEFESEWNFDFIPRENDVVSFKNAWLFDYLKKDHGTGVFRCRTVRHELINDKEDSKIMIIINLEPEDRPKVI